MQKIFPPGPFSVFIPPRAIKKFKKVLGKKFFTKTQNKNYKIFWFLTIGKTRTPGANVNCLGNGGFFNPQ